MSFGNWLEKKLLLSGKTQAECADALNVRRATVNVWIRQNVRPSIDYVKPLAKFLEVEESEVFKRL